jgi:hypothetical protein
MGTARHRGDDRLLEHMVHLIDQEPGAPVGHVHLARRRRDRSGLGHELEKMHLAGTDALFRSEFDAQRRLGISHAGTLTHRIENLEAEKIFRHPGESRDPLNSFHASSAAQFALIQWVPTFVGVMKF